MAKVRRTIRKVTRAGAYFDEQQWPVNLALFVLGGFLLGAAVAYQDFDDPRWYANAWLSVIGVPLLIGGAMLALRYVSNRVVRRGMQFALVMSLVAHLLMIIASVELNIFNRTVADVIQPRELVERRVPDYSPFRPREQQDHERPIETPVPEVDSDPIERQEAEETQAVPQPTPVPEPQPNPNPTLTERQTPDTPTPRMSEAPSQLSRSQASVTPNISRAAPNPNNAQSASRQPTLQAADTSAQRQSANRDPAPPMAQTDPIQTSPSSAAVARRETPTEQPQDRSAPTLPRSVNNPTRTPVAQTTSESQPNQAQQTTPDPLQAAPTATTRRQTTSPTTQRSDTEPTPVQPDQSTPTPQRRQQPSPTQVQVAATPQASPSRQQRVTSRPEPQTVAQTTSPTPSANSASAQLNQSAATAVSRANTSVDAARAAVADPTTPTPQPTPSQVARRQTQPNPTPAPEVTPNQVARRTAPARPSDSPNAPAPTAVAQATTTDASLSASSTAATRTPTTRPQVARATGDPSPATARNPTNSPSASQAQRSQTNDSPTLAQTPGSVGRTQVTRSSQPFASAESSIPTASAPNTADANALRPAESSISRQPTNSPGASDNNRPSRETPTASASNQVAQASSERAALSNTPSLEPAVTPTTPARSQLTGELASPTPIENPAVAKNSQSDGQQPSMQAAPTALSRGTAGVAGIGRSANLDRNEPAGESPSLVASASARRRESTRADESMSLNDSQPALVARNRAGEQRPSSVLQAQNVETATAAGAETPAEISATASASLTRAASDSQLDTVNATKGSSEVDIGPTRLVANSGADRAAGGGQPELNFETQTQVVTRNSRGGETTMSLAADQVAPNPTAPEADGGGEPIVQAPDSTAVAQRMDAGGDTPASGGPSQAAQEGPSAEPNAAERMAVVELARAEGDADQEPGGAAGGAEGEKDDEDEEERARRLAAARQRAGGSPEIDIAGTEITDTPATSDTTPGESGGITAPDAASANVARQASASGGLNRPQGAQSDAGEPATAQGGAQLAGDVRVRRAESVDAAIGAATPGGGSDAPRRSATGPSFAANVEAEVLAMAGQPASGGSPDSSPLAAQGANVGRVASGRSSASPTGPIGALADTTPSDGALRTPGASPAQRNASTVADAGPITDQGDVSGGPRRQLVRLGAPQVAEVASPSELLASVAPAATGEEMAASLAAVATQVGRVSRAATNSALSVEVDAIEGPSGLVGLDAGSPGISARRSEADSIDVNTNTTKFLRRATGGLPDINTAAIAAATPFQRRADRGRGQMGGDPGQPGPQTNRAIEAGLVFLTKHQLADGSWSLKGINNEPVAYSSDAAATGLCLLAYQGAGYNHREHKYAEVVRSGLDFLLKNQDESGSLFVPSDSRSNEFSKLYTHGIATIAVCEAYGMTQDPALRDAAQKAIDYIIETQDPNYGGWRYSPGKFSDTSVTGWMTMALKSGELAGLDVDKDAYTRIQLWLDRAQLSPKERHLYCYNPLAPNTPARRLGREASKSMTSVGLLSRLYMGWRRDNINMMAGADYLSELENLPAIGFAEELNPLKKKRDTYYWYYGTQVMYHMGGDHWEKWNNALRPILIDSQVKTGELAGSWDPYKPVPDRWGLAVGRLYVTTMNLLSLEVYYRHLPLYYDTGR